MCELKGKHIAIGITGGIAAYKSLSLIRLFQQAGCEVRVVATRHALEFVTPLTIETLSQNKLYSELFDNSEARDVHHISMADWADCLVVAPATANIIGKYACGIADDALSTLLLAMRKPVFVAPAMNDKMYSDLTVQHNIELLKQKGVRIMGPASGYLACGSRGAGRMVEPEQIAETVIAQLAGNSRFAGKKVLVTAGPTYEPIDPVRFIGNHSSGLMGFALAECAAAQGAQVILVAGPTHLTVCHPSVHRVDVTTAEQMYQQCVNVADEQDVFIMSAAVADYTPAVVAPEKIKKSDKNLEIELVKTKDILASIGQTKRDSQLLIGFALETENEMDNAMKKLHTKNADAIVLNSLRTEGAGFRTQTNQVTMITKGGNVFKSELKSKPEIAGDILNLASDMLNHKVE